MNPNYCRPATGTASANCRPGTRTEMSSIYRARTYRLADHLATGMAPIVSLMEIHIASDLVGDTGIEPVTSSV